MPVNDIEILLEESTATFETSTEDVALELLQYPPSGDANAVAADLAAHEARQDNPHNVTYAQLGDKPKLQHTHIQMTPVSSVTINHGLGRLVSNVFVEDTGGNDWAATIQNVDLNNTTIYIGQIMAFTAILT